jgi:hypothetical protein
MNMFRIRPIDRRAALALCALACLGQPPAALAQQGSPNAIVYRCPGTPVLYTDALSADEAKSRGCKAIESAPVTVLQDSQPRASAPAPAAPPRTAQQRVDPADQRARDGDARRILNDELQREQAALAELQREYNGGQPDRRGDERNYQKYLDRVAELKAAVDRKEADVAAIKRELGKLPP